MMIGFLPLFQQQWRLQQALSERMLRRGNRKRNGCGRAAFIN